LERRIPKIEEFIRSLRRAVTDEPVFDPWWQWDQYNDTDKGAPSIRRGQLHRYLCERLSTGKIVLVGEALGYQGGKFTGISMTSERILLGEHSSKGILTSHVFSTGNPKKTSRSELKPKGFSEPTGTVVWRAISESRRRPNEFILWNIFPWHPFNPQKGYLSNRTPTASEVAEGAVIFSNLLESFHIEKIFAVGRKSAYQLSQMGISAAVLRHPAQGGATQFRKQFAKLIS
jgi:hypothetical protein